MSKKAIDYGDLPHVILYSAIAAVVLYAGWAISTAAQRPKSAPLDMIIPTEPVACTMEARVCPDGSSVGRTGPRCEFAPCPGSLR